jgi:hypothetical protein
MNVLYAQQSVHSAVEQVASDVRAGRLLQIKQELSKMRDCPPESKVWWDKGTKFVSRSLPLRSLSNLQRSLA